MHFSETPKARIAFTIYFSNDWFCFTLSSAAKIFTVVLNLLPIQNSVADPQIDPHTTRKPFIAQN